MLKIDLFVPTIDEEILKIFLKKNKQIKNIFCPKKEISLIFLDKYKTSIFLKKNKVICFPKNNPYRATTHTDKRSRIMLEIVYEI